jgi:hypothetical protein
MKCTAKHRGYRFNFQNLKLNNICDQSSESLTESMYKTSIVHDPDKLAGYFSLKNTNKTTENLLLNDSRVRPRRIVMESPRALKQSNPGPLPGG